MQPRGKLSTFNMTKTERDLFIEYLEHSLNSPAIEFLKYLLGDDLIQFLDVMSGTLLKIPAASTLERDFESIRAYLYVKKREFTEDGIREAAKVFGKAPLTIRRYALKVARVLDEEGKLEGDALNNFVKNVKCIDGLDSCSPTRVEESMMRIVEERSKKGKEEQEG